MVWKLFDEKHNLVMTKQFPRWVLSRSLQTQRSTVPVKAIIYERESLPINNNTKLTWIYLYWTQLYEPKHNLQWNTQIKKYWRVQQSTAFAEQKVSEDCTLLVMMKHSTTTWYWSLTICHVQIYIRVMIACSHSEV